MRPGVLLDTGPIIAYLHPRDTHHDWAVETFASLQLPAVSCEPVITECCFLAERNGRPAAQILHYASVSGMQIGLQLKVEMAALAALMQRYANVPMSLADACLVRLAEKTGLPICTLDRDFEIYRTQRSRALTLIMPQPRALHEP